MNVLSDVYKSVKAKIIGWSNAGELGAQGMNGALGGLGAGVTGGPKFLTPVLKRT